MRDPVEIGPYLRDLRKEQKLKQADLAIAAGLDTSAISRIETGNRELTIGELFSISRELKKRPSEVLAEFEEKFKDSFNFRSNNESLNHPEALLAFKLLLDQYYYCESLALDEA